MRKFFTLFILVSILLTNSTISHAQQVDVNDSLALVDFYNSTGGPNWVKNTGWLNGPATSWYGVEFGNFGETAGRVIFLALQNCNLTGQLPKSVGSLAKLQRLWLGGNKLTGSIPDFFGNLPELWDIILERNQFTGTIPLSLGNLNLGELDLSQNQLTGNLPDTLRNLNNLNSLYLNDNQLVGDIPISLSSLHNLINLFLGNNQLTGNIPSWIVNNSHLSELDLSGNHFTGSIPAALGNLVGLSGLGLGNNQLTDSIPSSLSSLINLTVLGLNNNQLTGAIPSWLGNFSQLNNLSLNNNQFSGTIPSTLGNLSTRLFFLSLGNNHLTGSIPTTLGDDTSLNYLDLSYNQLTGAVPASFANLKYLTNLSLDHNWLIGSLLDPLANFKVRYLNYPYVLTLDSNYFTFDGLENIAQNDTFAIYSPQYNIPLHFKNNFLSASAGGTLTNNTYKWYKGDTLIKTINADSTYKPTTAGNYWVTVTNSIVSKLTLRSDTVAITASELPVTFLNFTAQTSHNGNLLQWQTATELNSNYFSIQRSTNGIQFTNIGKVAAAGNTALAQSYQYNDALAGLNPIPSTLFYRLQEVDKDGGETYSKIIRLDNIGGTPAIMLMYPNPVRDALNIQVKGVSNQASITITTTEGKTLLAQKTNVLVGQNITINTQQLAAGVYFIHVQYDGKSLVEKFVKE